MTQKSSTERFYAIVWPHRAMVLRCARILCGDATEADDLSQDAMLKAFKAIDQTRQVDHVKSWLRTILRNTWIDRRRSRATRAGDMSLDEIEREPADRPAAPTPGDPTTLWSSPRATLNTFSDQQIIDALQELPEPIRWALLLVDVEGLEQQDAAGVLGVPEGTVKSRLHRDEECSARCWSHAPANLG